ncbi:MAG: hypothetical protein LBK50_00075 [Candidatus Nomurabacteria bacterium]|jgi:hypothetical protein|nr:hypothetical protein [Candidatus Nomurabacteria bacterium]
MADKNVKYFQSKQSKLYSTVYLRVYNQAKSYYESLIQNPRRKPFVRSKYFNRKVFIDEFWSQVRRYNLADRRRRLAFYLCAIDLIKNSRYEPTIKYESGKKLYEFYGIAKNSEKFAVHFRKSREHVCFVSCFPK